MNILPRAHSMRIIALPLARVKISPGTKLKVSDTNANTLLVFYHFDLISPYGREDLSWSPKVIKSVTNKAADLWTNLGKAPKGSWKVGVFLSKVEREVTHAKQLWTYELGERIADQIEFEELALRNIDPSLGPVVPPTGTSTKQFPNVGEAQSLPKVRIFAASTS